MDAHGGLFRGVPADLGVLALAVRAGRVTEAGQHRLQGVHHGVQDPPVADPAAGRVPAGGVQDDHEPGAVVAQGLATRFLA
ncbi:hypothetical protein SVIO_079350 [Streptomyces violaceusniger]|uniref:Uncharacterized protein n=1 Tax=Streptomyces violaceusniger TaxID=68280 RepID=A0A4D4L7Z3_STRVO|nr:hypothetical protein SVIO_079350 [Streptomyces violaceusniger]